MSLAELLWKAGQSLSPDNLNRRMRLVHNRLAALEDLSVDWIAETDALKEVGLTRIDDALSPAFAKVQAMSENGFLQAGSSTDISFVLGEQSLTINEGNERDLFAPSPFVVLTRSANADDYAVAQVSNYDAATGVLNFDVLVVSGAVGPHSDVIASVTSGAALAAILLGDSTVAAKDLALAARAAAEAAQGAAETAQGAAETAQGAAETAQGAAETAQGGAQAAETASNNSAVAAAASAASAAAIVASVRGPRDFTDVLATLDLLPDDVAGIVGTFTRATPAVYFDAFGVMKTAAAGQIRIDYDPLTGAFRGILIEQESENFALHNTDFDNAVWIKLRGSADTVTPIAAPDGTLTAYKFVENTEDNSHLFYDGFNFEAGKTYTWSEYFKAGGRDIVDVRLHNAAFGTNVQYRFDFAAETAAQITAGTNDSGYIEDIGGGWFRVWVTADATVTAAANCYVFLHDGVGNNYLGDGVSGVYPWGCQVEEGEAPTSLIITGATPVTREADKLMLALDDWYNPAGGTLYLEATAPAPQIARNALAIDDNTGDNYIMLRSSSAPARVDAGGVVSANLVSSWWNGSASRLAFAFQDNDFALSQDGATVVTDDSGVVPAGLTQMQVGGRRGTTFFNGHIRRVVYWPQRLPNAELEAMSSWNT